jgi:hypothetical protein
LKKSNKPEMPKPCNQEQVSRFIETARALGCDEDKERFEAKLGKIARQRPKKESGAMRQKPKDKKAAK